MAALVFTFAFAVVATVAAAEAAAPAAAFVLISSWFILVSSWFLTGSSWFQTGFHPGGWDHYGRPVDVEVGMDVRVEQRVIICKGIAAVKGHVIGRGNLVCQK